MSAQEPLRVGLIGLGYIGRTVGGEFHNHPDARVAAVADIDGDARERLGEKFSVPVDARYADYASMLEAEDLDATLVGTPHTLHYEQVVDSLDRGLHVLCDKPLATDLDRAREIVRRAEGGDLTLMVGYQRHLNPAFIRARERFDGEREPTHVTAEVTQNWVERFRGTWRTDPELSGGGNLYDTGSHLLDAVLWTTGLAPARVAAEMSFLDEDRRVDRRANVIVEFENGATATVSVYSDAPCVREHIHVWDDKGAVYLEGREWEPRKLTIVDDESGEYTPYVSRRGQQNKAEAFIESVREGTEPPATVRDALAVTAVTEAAYEAARSEEWVDVDLST